MGRMKNEDELFWKLLEPEYTQAMMYCRKLTSEKEAGDDLYQDALVNALTKFSTLRGHGAFRAWLYRIITNTYISDRRSFRRRQEVSLSSQPEMAMGSLNPSARYSARLMLRTAFAAVTARERALFVLYELEGWTTSELARMFRSTRGAIKVRLYRARNKMKRHLLSSDRKSGKPRLSGQQEEREARCVVARPNSE